MYITKEPGKKEKGDQPLPVTVERATVLVVDDVPVSRDSCVPYSKKVVVFPSRSTMMLLTSTGSCENVYCVQERP